MKVPSATATIKRQMYDTKKTYVLGRVITRKNACQSQVTSVRRVAPRPKRLIAMCRSRYPLVTTTIIDCRIYLFQ